MQDVPLPNIAFADETMAVAAIVCVHKQEIVESHTSEQAKKRSYIQSRITSVSFAARELDPIRTRTCAYTAVLHLKHIRAGKLKVRLTIKVHECELRSTGSYLGDTWIFGVPMLYRKIIPGKFPGSAVLQLGALAPTGIIAHVVFRAGIVFLAGFGNVANMPCLIMIARAKLKGRAEGMPTKNNHLFPLVVPFAVFNQFAPGMRTDFRGFLPGL